MKLLKVLNEGIESGLGKLLVAVSLKEVIQIVELFTQSLAFVRSI